MTGMTVFYDEAMLEYRAPDGVFEAPPSPLLARQMPAPEGPERILNTKSILERGPLADLLEWRTPDPATDGQILRVHTTGHLDALKEADRRGRCFSTTTYMPPGGLRAARLSAGAAIASARHVAGGSGSLAYALVRPPSHHAQPDAVDGYCFVNGVALAVEEAIDRGSERVAVLDWDAHHGNGTQACFYDRDDVLTISIHMDHGAWGEDHPQTGGVEEIGTGAGEGRNLNLPLPFGAGDYFHARLFELCVAPAIGGFAPDVIVLANGQDASQFDPNGRQMLSMAGFHTLATELRSLAAETCEGRIVMTQEGGYNIAYAPFCAYAVAAGLLGRDLEVEDPIAFYPEDRTRADADLRNLVDRHPLL